LRSATNHYNAAIIKLNEPVILLSFHPSLVILINVGKISIYFFIALPYLLYPLSLVSQSFTGFFSERFTSSIIVYLSIVIIIITGWIDINPVA